MAQNNRNRNRPLIIFAIVTLLLVIALAIFHIRVSPEIRYDRAKAEKVLQDRKETMRILGDKINNLSKLHPELQVKLNEILQKIKKDTLYIIEIEEKLKLEEIVNISSKEQLDIMNIAFDSLIHQYIGVFEYKNLIRDTNDGINDSILKLERRLHQLQLQRTQYDSLIQLRNNRPYKIQIDEVSRLNRDKKVTLRDDNTVYLMVRFRLLGSLYKKETFKAIVYSTDESIIPNSKGNAETFDVNTCQGSYIFRIDRPSKGNHFSSLRLSSTTSPGVLPQAYSLLNNTK